MDFKALLKFVKSQGCKVRVYKSKRRLEGNAIGLFYEEPDPHIKIATKGRSKREVVSVLLHEFAHFCQWRDGFSKYFDGICWPHQLLDDWIEGEVKLSKREQAMVRATMLAVEYDAELRSYAMGLELGVKNFDPDYHLSEAQSYMAAIKWAFENKKDWEKRAEWRHFPSKIMTHDELFAPLSKKENKILKKNLKIKKPKRGR